MLTKEHGISSYKDKRVIPDQLNRRNHSHYLSYAEKMLEIFRQGIGKTRQCLHREIEKIFTDEPDCPPRRIHAFCKLLDDASVYDQDRGKKSVHLRIKVFRLAASYHPLVREKDRLFEHSEEIVKTDIANELKMDWKQIENNMYADVMENHRLKEFIGYVNGEALLSRYNVAQAQVLLFRAIKMTISAGNDFKTILHYAKLARLLHTIQPLGPGRYVIILDGPASVLHNTMRYGIAMAKFLPALLTCNDWKMEAIIKTRKKGYTLRFLLSADDGLKSHLPPPNEFDSSIEEAFAQKWGDESRDGWKLLREGGIIYKGQKIFIPDFVLQHENGQRVYLEIVGFWTPEYLRKKFDTLHRFKDHNILLAIAEAVAEKIPNAPANAIFFKSSLLLKDVLSRLNPAPG